LALDWIDLLQCLAFEMDPFLNSTIIFLKTMFPEWDEETMSMLLVANNYHAERTVEAIVGMCSSYCSNSAEATSKSHDSISMEAGINETLRQV
jgi:hypothetical protein